MQYGTNRIEQFLVVSLLLFYPYTSTLFVAGQSYDVIVVGSGPGGLAAAEYLTRESNVTVLVLEAGLPSLQESGGTDRPDYATSKGWTKFDIPGEYGGTIYNPVNEKYRVDWISDAYMWLGKLVGGCSSINAALYFRTPDSYVIENKWPFHPDRVNQVFDEMESSMYTQTNKPSPDGKWYTQEGYNIVANGLKSIGYSEQKSINDPISRNAKHQTFGHAPFTFKNGLRDSPAKTFLGAMKKRSNFKLITSAKVDYIIHSKGKATGVVYNGNIQVSLTSRGTIIMAAGALSTPKVLIQSGIGPQDQLNRLNSNPSSSSSNNFPGIKTNEWVINENVGKSLFDTAVVFASFSHPNMKSFFYNTQLSQNAINQFMTQGQTGPWASSGPTLIGYENYQVNGRMYQFQTTVLTNGFGEHNRNPNAFTTSLYINNPESRDYSSFDSNGNWIAFTQKTLYLATLNDLQAMQSYTNKIVRALQTIGATFLSAAQGQSVNDWVASTKNAPWITHHFGGTCYTSSDTKDTKRCADETFKVIGTSNIFVSDGSLMKDGTVNPYGFIMYIGREAAEQVKTFLVAQPPPPPPPSCSTIEKNVDYIGNDIGNSLSATPEGCCAICSQKTGCRAFSWTKHNGGTCWLKSGKSTTKSDPNVQSGTLNVTTPPPPGNQCGTIQNNVDYIGNDIGNAFSNVAEGCCDICKAKTGCYAYTWSNFNGGTCWLKSAKGSTSVKAGVRSGTVGTPPVSPSCTLENNVDYFGNDIKSVSSASADGCCSICKSTTGCQVYTWTNSNGGTCWLKSKKTVTTIKNGAISGTINN
jgi:cellobiose dehydrogenase (acceptor)